MTQEVKKNASTRGKSTRGKVEKQEAVSKDEGREYKVEKKRAPAKEEVEVLGPTFEEGKPDGEEMGKWRQKLGSRAEKLKYLQTGERYWFAESGYGSEKRKKPA